MKESKTIKIQTPIAKTTRRAKMFIRRALKEKNRGSLAFEKSREAITKALQCGLQPGQAVEIEVMSPEGSKVTELFAIQDNFAGEVAFKNAYVSHFELKKVPKFRRQEREAATEEIGGVD